MRSQDIVIGRYYRLKTQPNYCYARAIEILKPKPAYRCKNETEKQVKHTVVKCEWMVGKNDTVYLIKYFKPADLQEEK